MLQNSSGSSFIAIGNLPIAAFQSEEGADWLSEALMPTFAPFAPLPVPPALPPLPTAFNRSDRTSPAMPAVEKSPSSVQSYSSRSMSPLHLSVAPNRPPSLLDPSRAVTMLSGPLRSQSVTQPVPPPFMLSISARSQSMDEIPAVPSLPPFSSVSKVRRSPSSPLADAILDEDPISKRFRLASRSKKAARSSRGTVGSGLSCHQCKSRKPTEELVFCTKLFQKKTKNESRPCQKKFCVSCLQKFYHLEAHGIRGKEAMQTSKFVCPSCAGYCVCAVCKRREDVEVPEQLAEN